MNRSIQRFLTTNALSVVGLAILIAIIANFFLRQETVQLHLDAELSLEARVIESFLVQRLTPQKAQIIQSKINNIPLETRTATEDKSSTGAVIKRLINSTQFQVWDLQKGSLILHSPNAPALPFDHQIGYGHVNHAAHSWRTYSIELPHLQYKIISMQRHDQRLGYEKQFIADTLIILIITFLFLIFALRLIITRSLTTLGITTAQLKKREPSNLNPIQYDCTPTEVRPLVIEINRLMSQLKSTLEREQQFAADAAHELKTPLSAMKAQIQVAMRQPLDQQKEAFQGIESSIERYNHIIRQLLTLSRTLSHTTLENPQWLSLPPLVQNIIAPLVPLALKRNITLELHHDTLPQILSNSTLLTTATSNLIDNAIKYTKPHDTIQIQLSTSSNHITIDVIDHGCGIEAKNKELALQRFTRIYGSNTQGSGLGLSIVKEICQHLYGQLILLDTPGGGLTTRIKLPINFKKQASSNEPH